MSTVQDILQKDLLESSDDNEMIQLLEFHRVHGVPLTQNQVRASFILKEFGLEDIAEYVSDQRHKMTPRSIFAKVLRAVTLYDRIKGNAKLGQLLKANANPASGQQGVPMGIKDGVK